MLSYESNPWIPPPLLTVPKTKTIDNRPPSSSLSSLLTKEKNILSKNNTTATNTSNNDNKRKNKNNNNIKLDILSSSNKNKNNTVGSKNNNENNAMNTNLKESNDKKVKEKESNSNTTNFTNRTMTNSSSMNRKNKNTTKKASVMPIDDDSSITSWPSLAANSGINSRILPPSTTKSNIGNKNNSKDINTTTTITNNNNKSVWFKSSSTSSNNDTTTTSIKEDEIIEQQQTMKQQKVDTTSKTSVWGNNNTNDNKENNEKKKILPQCATSATTSNNKINKNKTVWFQSMDDNNNDNAKNEQQQHESKEEKVIIASTSKTIGAWGIMNSTTTNNKENNEKRKTTSSSTIKILRRNSNDDTTTTTTTKPLSGSSSSSSKSKSNVLLTPESLSKKNKDIKKDTATTTSTANNNIIDDALLFPPLLSSSSITNNPVTKKEESFLSTMSSTKNAWGKTTTTTTKMKSLDKTIPTTTTPVPITNDTQNNKKEITPVQQSPTPLAQPTTSKKKKKGSVFTLADLLVPSTTTTSTTTTTNSNTNNLNTTKTKKKITSATTSSSSSSPTKTTKNEKETSKTDTTINHNSNMLKIPNTKSSTTNIINPKATTISTNIQEPEQPKRRGKPKKKHLSTLKKKILQERLRQWNELHTTTSTITSSEYNPLNNSSITHYIVGILISIKDDDTTTTDTIETKLVQSLSNESTSSIIHVSSTIQYNDNNYRIYYYLVINENNAFHLLKSSSLSKKNILDGVGDGNLLSIVSSIIIFWNDTNDYPTTANLDNTIDHSNAATNNHDNGAIDNNIGTIKEYLNKLIYLQTINNEYITFDFNQCFDDNNYIMIQLTINNISNNNDTTTKTNTSSKEQNYQIITDLYIKGKEYGIVSNISYNEDNSDDSSSLSIILTYKKQYNIQDEENILYQSWCNYKHSFYTIHVTLLSSTTPSTTTLSKLPDEQQSKEDQIVSTQYVITIQLNNIFTEDDYDDEECMDETKNDLEQVIHSTTNNNIIVKDINMNIEFNQISILYCYTNKNDMDCIINKWNTMIIGGIPVNVTIIHNNNNDGDDTNTSESSEHVITLHDIFSEDDYDDIDCMDETKKDITLLANKYISSNIEFDENDNLIHIKYSNNCDDIQSILKYWNETILGGCTINATLQSKQQEDTNFAIQLNNIFTEDDYDDEECMDETKNDIIDLANKYGNVIDIHFYIDGNDDSKDCVISYDDKLKEGQKVVLDKWCNTILAGNPIQASLVTTGSTTTDINSTTTNNNSTITLCLQNVLWDDDINDNDCYEETKNDFINLAKESLLFDDNNNKTTSLIQYSNIQLNKDDRNVYITYTYDNNNNSNNDNGGDDIGVIKDILLEYWSNIIIGGITIKVYIVNDDDIVTKDESNTNITISNPNEAKNEQEEEDKQSPSSPTKKVEEKDVIKPMYSGDKLIPERFAACKRVPKIPNSGNPRDYASIYIEKFHSKDNDDDILKEFKKITKDMLQELMKFQQRAKDDNNARSRRRLVFGLREVARYV